MIIFEFLKLNNTCLCLCYLRSFSISGSHLSWSSVEADSWSTPVHHCLPTAILEDSILCQLTAPVGRGRDYEDQKMKSKYLCDIVSRIEFYKFSHLLKYDDDFFLNWKKTYVCLSFCTVTKKLWLVCV